MRRCKVIPFSMTTPLLVQQREDLSRLIDFSFDAERRADKRNNGSDTDDIISRKYGQVVSVKTKRYPYANVRRKRIAKKEKPD